MGPSPSWGMALGGWAVPPPAKNGGLTAFFFWWKQLWEVSSTAQTLLHPQPGDAKPQHLKEPGNS